MTALLLANIATLLLRSHLLFPTVYLCALFHLVLVFHLLPNAKQTCTCFEVCVIVASEVGGDGLWSE